ncbi:MAG TPA: zf-HC2 domain-containing protein [Polyangia bacterium]|jgi:endogenous inhibitor of DNA gyrase (YacG/DUF329 family)|nr:zf-HC2 domain-containing protein [Polyangia bacterium]
MAALCDLMDLEAWADGRLAPERARMVEAHAAECPRCRREAEWLRAEQALLARRRGAEAPLPMELWQGIERRLPEAVPRRRSRVWMGVAALAMAAAAMFAVVVPGVHVGRFAQGVLRHGHRQASLAEATDALDDAEQSYRQAIAELEEAYAAAHRRMPEETATRLDASLEEARAEITEARSQAGQSMEARLRLLDGYAEYLFALQTIVHAEVR